MLMVDSRAKVMLKKHHSFITLLMGLGSHCLAFMLLSLIFFHHVLISDIVEEVLCLEDVFRDSPPILPSSSYALFLPSSLLFNHPHYSCSSISLATPLH